MNDLLLIVRDISGRKRLQIASWKYYEIVDELRAFGIEQENAYEAGKWAAHAKLGETMSLGKFIFEIKEVRKGSK